MRVERGPQPLNESEWVSDSVCVDDQIRAEKQNK